MVDCEKIQENLNKGVDIFFEKMNINKVDGDIFDSIVQNFNMIEEQLEDSKNNSLETDNDKNDFDKIIKELDGLGESDDKVNEYILKILDSKNPITALALYDHNVRKFKEDLVDKKKQHGGYVLEDRIWDNKKRYRCFGLIGTALIYAGSIASGGAPAIAIGVVFYAGAAYFAKKVNEDKIAKGEQRKSTLMNSTTSSENKKQGNQENQKQGNQENQKGGNMDRYMNEQLCKSVQEFMEENKIEEKLEELKNPPEEQTEFDKLRAKLKAQLGETAEATEEAKKYSDRIKGGRRMRKLKGKSLKKRGGRKSIKKGVKKVVKKGGRKSVRKSLNKRRRKSVRR